MAAFDTALTPVSVAPANTSDTTLDPNNTLDAAVMVDVVNISADTILVRVGITPSGGSVHWKRFDIAVPGNDGLPNLGPWFLQTGDVVTVRTATANNAVFSLTGVESS